VVVETVGGGGGALVVCSVVVVLVTLSGPLPQPAARHVPVSTAPMVKIRKADIILVM
jgi:uncharacterized protein YhhL (DUF1145 family)